MKTSAFPYEEIAHNTYEIGEFDCASIFLLVGDEKTMLIDTEIGIGDLKGFIATLTGKPLMVCYTHDTLITSAVPARLSMPMSTPRICPTSPKAAGLA